MTRLMRPAAIAGAAALLTFSLTACGGDDGGGGSGGSGGNGGGDAPTSASQDDFCQAFADAFLPLANLQGDPTEDQFNDFKDAVSHLADVGTPSDISDDNRAGFEVFVDAVNDGSYDDFKNEQSDSLPGVSADDETKAEAFFTWAGTQCIDQLRPTDVPSDAIPSSS